MKVFLNLCVVAGLMALPAWAANSEGEEIHLNDGYSLTEEHDTKKEDKKSPTVTLSMSLTEKKDRSCRCCSILDFFKNLFGSNSEYDEIN